MRENDVENEFHLQRVKTTRYGIFVSMFGAGMITLAMLKGLGFILVLLGMLVLGLGAMFVEPSITKSWLDSVKGIVPKLRG